MSYIRRSTTQEAVRYVSHLLAVCLLLSCGTDSTSDGVIDQEVVQIGPSDLVSPVLYRLTANRSVILNELAAAQTQPILTLRINGNAVIRDTALTIAQVSPNVQLTGIVTPAFVLSPDVTSLEAPFRIRIRLAQAPAAISKLRLARLDTGGKFYRPVPGQAGFSFDGSIYVAGQTTDFGVYAVVDTEKANIEDDVLPTDEWRGMHFLDLGAVDEAKASFETAYAGNPTPQSTFGYAITRLLSLPGLLALDDFMTACGEQVWSSGAVFGPSGYFAADELRGRANTALELGVGFDAVNLVRRPLLPSRTVAELDINGICLDNRAQISLPAGHLRLRMTDPNFDGESTRLVATLRIDPNKPLNSSTQTFAQLLTAAGNGMVTIPLADLNGRLEALRGDTLVGGQSGGIRNTTTTGEQIGLFRASKQGELRITALGSALQDPLEIEFVDVQMEPQWVPDLPEVLNLTGTVNAQITEAPSLDAVPLLKETLTIEDFLQACTTAAIPTLDDDYFKGVVSAIVGEAQAIVSLLDEATTTDDFRFDLSLGLFQLPGIVRLGPAEANLVAAVLDVAVAAGDLFAGYEWFSGDMRNLLTSAMISEFGACDPCTNVCSETSEQRTVFDSQLTVDALNGSFLQRSPGAGDLLAARDSLISALAHLKVALFVAAFDTPINFQADGAINGIASLVTLVDSLSAGLLASSVTDGVQVNLNGTLFIHMADLFANPPTIADVRVTGGAMVNDPPFFLDSVDTIGCPPLTCTDENDLRVGLSGWLLSGLIDNYISDGTGVACTTDPQCGVVGATCGRVLGETFDTCQYPDLTTDHLQIVGDELLGPINPPFINQRALAEIDAAIGLTATGN